MNAPRTNPKWASPTCFDTCVPSSGRNTMTLLKNHLATATLLVAGSLTCSSFYLLRINLRQRRSCYRPTHKITASQWQVVLKIRQCVLPEEKHVWETHLKFLVIKDCAFGWYKKWCSPYKKKMHAKERFILVELCTQRHSITSHKTRIFSSTYVRSSQVFILIIWIYCYCCFVAFVAVCLQRLLQISEVRLPEPEMCHGTWIWAVITDINDIFFR